MEEKNNPESVEESSTQETLSDTPSGNEKQCQDSEKDSEKYKNLWMRAEAEIENLRSRHIKETTQVARYSLQKFVEALLPAVDNIFYSLEKKEDQGLRKILENFLAIFAKFEIEQFAPKQGDNFDPRQHEALATQNHHQLENNTILSVLQLGYKLRDRLIRPARVIVCKKEKQDD